MSDSRLPKFPKQIEFEWDQFNRTKLRLRHGINTKEAEQPFLNEHLIIFDEKHSFYGAAISIIGRD